MEQCYTIHLPPNNTILIHGKKLIKYIGWMRIIQSYVSRIFMLMSHTMCNQLLLAVVLPDKRHYS